MREDSKEVKITLAITLVQSAWDFATQIGTNSRPEVPPDAELCDRM